MRETWLSRWVVFITAEETNAFYQIDSLFNCRWEKSNNSCSWKARQDRPIAAFSAYMCASLHPIAQFLCESVQTTCRSCQVVTKSSRWAFFQCARDWRFRGIWATFEWFCTATLWIFIKQPQSDITRHNYTSYITARATIAVIVVCRVSCLVISHSP